MFFSFLTAFQPITAATHVLLSWKRSKYFKYKHIEHCSYDRNRLAQNRSRAILAYFCVD